MRDRDGILVLVLLSVVAAFSFQGSHGLFEPSEGRYAEVAREMLASGNYLEPTLDSHAHWTKPPMAYWAAAAGMSLLGRNAWGARLFNAIAFALTALAVAAAGSRLWDRQTGFVAGLVYITSLFSMLSAAFLTADTLVTMWEVFAVAAFIMSSAATARRSAVWWNRAMWLSFGLGFFTKGPPALIPLLALIVFHRSTTRRTVMFDPFGIVLFLVSGFWWYIAVSAQNPGLMEYFVREEVLGRNLTDEFHRNPQWWAPFAMYVPVLLVGLGPWLGAVARIAGREVRTRRLDWSAVVGAQGTPHRLLFLWFVLPLVVFFISKSRLVLYVLPLHAPLALATASTVTRRLRPRSIATLAAISLVLCLGIKSSLSRVNRDHNALLLHSAVVSAGGADARYMFLDERKEYGLQFYFDGAIERVSIGHDERWAARNLGVVASEVANAPAGSRYVFVTGTRGVRAAQDIFAAGPEKISTSRAYGHDIVVVEAAAQ